MVYLSDSVKASERVVTQQPQYRLQPGDRLDINVTALNQQAAQEFNVLPVVSKTGDATALGSAGGYLVADNGNIWFPQVGNVYVRGMTTQEVSEKLQNELLKYLKEPAVMVYVSNFKVNVLGEVNRPGTILVPDGKISILEVISQSGDLTVYGKRENVLVIREKDGKREFAKLDLTSNNIFSSPYFYLQQGDVVYVEMNKNKVLANDPTKAHKFKVISLILAGITAAALIHNSLK